jgi:prepilin-type N-terminal cleavage/methylation domain-containing protein
MRLPGKKFRTMYLMVFTKIRRGFTLIELLIVIAIIIIMVAVSIPITANTISERSLYNAAVQVQQDIQLVQQLAISYSTTDKFKIYFDPSDNKYYVEAAEDAVFNSPTDMTGRVITREFSSAYGFPKYFGVGSPPSIFCSDGSGGKVPVKEIHFNNLGELRGKHYNPDGTLGNGVRETHIILQNRTGSKKIQIIVSVIGRVSIKWIQR